MRTLTSPSEPSAPALVVPPPVASQPGPLPHPPLERVGAPPSAPARPRTVGLLRMLLGWIFLWAFLDKLLGLGMDTPASQAWVNGGSPAGGYLQFALEGKMLQDVFVGMAGPVTDVLFMAALLAVGVGVTLGIGMRLATAGGVLLMASLWLANLPLLRNPMVDQHVIYAVALMALTALDAGRTWGMGRAWADTALVRRVPLLR